MLKLKICGMKQPENMLEVAALLPHYMGFIFWQKSARYFDGVLPNLPKSIKKVGVFVQETAAEIQKKIKTHQLQAIQLHGNESAVFCANLKQMIDPEIEIIKVFSIADSFDFKTLEPFELVCDYFLFDTKGKLPGGNGTTFDWQVLANYTSTKPFFLSGGIGIDELKQLEKSLENNSLLKKLPLYAIDINSKFEIEPGLKNINLCRDAITCLAAQ